MVKIIEVVHPVTLACERVIEDILALMEKRGVTKKALAIMLHVNQEYVDEMLSGDTNLTLDMLFTIAFYLNVKVKVSFEPL